MGKVYLVGAGPGDPGLFTLKGKACLEQADIVIYDYLANEQLLGYVKPQAERIYVGKKAGQHTLKQEEINALLVASAQKYGCVVRLKGGDPFLFGRGGEEALELVKHQIPFEVVPGVTAGIAVPAYAGIPVSHREMASSVAFITGHEADEKPDAANVNWPALAKSCDTLVIFMGVKNLPHIVQELRTAGLAAETPAAIIKEGTYNFQQTVAGTLQDIVQRAQERQITAPAIIVIGKVAQLREQLAWFENRPLFGKIVVVTRQAAAEANLTKLLEQQGANVLQFPTIDIVEIRPNVPLEQALHKLDRYAWLLFTSGNAVEIFFNQVWAQGLDLRALHAVKIAVIGKPTAEKLQTYYLNADFTPDVFTSERLVAGMTAKFALAGQRVLFPGSTLSNPEIAAQLQQAGAVVDVIPIYETRIAQVAPELLDQLQTALAQNKIAWITFTSSSTVANFVSIVGQDFLHAQRARLPIASIGPVTTNTLVQYGLTPLVTAGEHTFQGLVAAMIK